MNKLFIFTLIVAGILSVWTLVLEIQIRQMNRTIDVLEHRIEQLQNPYPYTQYAYNGNN